MGRCLWCGDFFGGTRAVECIEGPSTGDAPCQWYTVVGCALCADGPCGHGVWQGAFHWPLAWGVVCHGWIIKGMKNTISKHIKDFGHAALQYYKENEPGLLERTQRLEIEDWHPGKPSQLIDDFMKNP